MQKAPFELSALFSTCNRWPLVKGIKCALCIYPEYLRKSPSYIIIIIIKLYFQFRNGSIVGYMYFRHLQANKRVPCCRHHTSLKQSTFDQTMYARLWNSTATLCCRLSKPVCESYRAIFCPLGLHVVVQLTNQNRAYFTCQSKQAKI